MTNPSNLPGSFGLWLRERRLAFGLTQEDLAARVGCARITVAKIETGERRPSRQMAERLAEILAVPAVERPMVAQWARGVPPVRQPGAGLHDPLALAAPPVPDPLPAALTPLVGREQDLVAVRDQMLQPGVRLLT